jgi:hypothetical protein
MLLFSGVHARNKAAITISDIASFLQYLGCIPYQFQASTDDRPFNRINDGR